MRHGFDLSKRTLLALDEGGVDEQVIDLMVALTYPKRFVVERRGGGSSSAGILTGNGWFDPMISPMMAGQFGDCFSPYGYGYRSYYSMCNSMGGYPLFGYDYYGYNRGYGRRLLRRLGRYWRGPTGNRRRCGRTAGRRPRHQRPRLHPGARP